MFKYVYDQINRKIYSNKWLSYFLDFDKIISINLIGRIRRDIHPANSFWEPLRLAEYELFFLLLPPRLTQVPET